MNKRGAALLLAAAMTFSSILPGQTAMAAGESYVTDAQLTAAVVEAPAKDKVIPDANQYEYQKQELAAFCHFGPNTFNEIEWGEHYGDRTPDDIFKLETNFDADKLVSSLKAAGFKKLIVTAKHHDGFCIWNSAYTTYDVESTSYAGYNYDDMGGDILAEISAACTAHDMDMGLYLSPWDIHDESYGYYDEHHNPTNKENDAKDYNVYYNNQLQEILGNPKYGNNGHFKEVWMDGAKGSGANAQEYDFETWFDTIQKNEGKKAGFDADCLLFGAESYSTVRWIGNENGYANEETWSKSKINRANNTIDSNHTGAQGTFIGFEDGNQWTVPEVDARITSGWFWGTRKNSPKSILDLGNMYFNSVGHNAPLLLNIPPNNQGGVDQAILDRVAEFGNNISETFQLNLAKDAAASATEVRGNALSYKPGNVLDGKDNTYWTVNDGTTTGTLQLDLKGQKTFDVVSIEEAIEFGQRIKSFKVEYSLDGGAWKTFDQGTTIGAKRLCRKAPVKADKLRITVTTTSAVPMISEVGIFKASQGFEKAKSAPAGMDVIDINDNGEIGFKFGSNWHPETGDQYLNGTNSWANAGTNFEVKFNGSKIYLIGTKDPNHGTANITIDGKSAGSIDTSATSRAVGQIIFASEDLEDGPHTLRLDTTNKAIGIEGAYVINNGGKGMVGIEQASYTMNEASTMDVKLVRVGGTTGDITVNFAPNPGSAIQDDYNTELNQNIVFKNGEKEKLAQVETRRNTKPTGNQYFTVALSTADKDLILGFNAVARINIIDAEGLTVEKLEALLDDCRALNEVNYQTESWNKLTAAMQTAEDRMAAGNLSGELLRTTYDALEKAKTDLVAREHYAENDRFVFPATANAEVTLEAELLERHNNTEGDKNWPLQVTPADWASNGKFLNCLNSNDQAKLYYTADRTGTYSAVVTYRSGAPENAIFWEEANGNITAGNVTAGASDNAGATHTANFAFEVTKPGDGVLVFKGGEKNAPQIDKMVITASQLDQQVFQVTKNAGANGVIAGPETVNEGENAVFTITPNEGYDVQDVKVNGTSVGAVTTHTVENVTANITIEATFVKHEYKYTAEDPFVFPAEVNQTAVLEAEYATLHNSGADEQWKLEVANGDWASNKKFVNSLNRGDEITIPYRAAVAGTYTVTVTFRSGSDKNYLDWTEENGKITAGTTPAGHTDSNATQTKTFEMVVNTAGAGVLKFAPKTENSPQTDKFDIVLKEAAAPVDPEDATSDALDYVTQAVTAGDQMDNHSADAVNDKDANSFWSTNWSSKPTEAERPEKFYIQMDLGETKPVAGVRVLPRQGDSMGDENGTPTKFTIKVSNDGTEWTDVLTAERPANAEGWRNWYIARFEKPVDARYVRYEAVNTYSDVADNMDLHMALAEIRAIKPAQEPQNPDQVAADAVIGKINSIGDVTLESEQAIKDARNAYNALTDAQKALVTNLTVLETAEAKLAELKDAAAQAEADKKAAAEASAKIDAIGEVALDSESKITDARNAYNALTDAQKALVGDKLAVLEAAEAKLAELQDAAAQTEADKAAAAAVDATIDAIGAVTLDSETKINDARNAYNALTDAQKALVKNLNVLEAAENTLKATVAKKAELDAAIKDAESKKSADYTDASWKAFAENLDAAKAVAAKKNVAMAEYENAVNALKTAMDQLAAKPAEPVKPVDPVQPTNPTTPAKPNTNSPVTRDSSNMMFWAAMAMLSAGAVVLLKKKAK